MHWVYCYCKNFWIKQINAILNGLAFDETQKKLMK